ncbi:hypothetical protein [Pelagicoccus mobilis]|uniref:Glycoside hydrolase family 42 N-terminal domain-containing protein n=1 Tax=Pelagicoccus mobilis TaxID=415221 RepID=A0A934RYX9_9BACT|nr:hypothetical protein [Pelagicoccus mobilis]MBK1877426.1 hypothetical protein [Pelagicoccus mobilis]
MHFFSKLKPYIFVLLILGLLGLGSLLVPSKVRHFSERGFINFRSPGKPYENIAEINNPNVIGSEMIIWWGDIEAEEGKYDWERLDAEFAAWEAVGKTVDVRLSAVHNNFENTPSWVFDKYNVRRIARGTWSGFENGMDDFQLSGNGIRTKGSISGNWTVKAGASTSGATAFLATDPSYFFDREAQYTAQFDFRMSSPGILTLRAKYSSGEGAHVFTQSFTGAAGERKTGSAVVGFNGSSIESMTWEWEGSGEVELDNLFLCKVNASADFVVNELDEDLGVWLLGESQEDKYSINWTSGSIRADSKVEGRTVVLRNNVELFPLQKGRGYAAHCLVRAVKDSRVVYRLVSENGDRVLEERSYDLKSGQEELMRGYSPRTTAEDFRMEVSLEGVGEIEIDTLKHRVWSDQGPCFPNYFDPIFREKWRALVEAFADRYEDHPSLGIVNVGGLGRWEEVMLDEDEPGVLDEQWMAYGFTRDNYLEHIIWAMDLYRERLPDTPLRICLAYGLKKQNDIGWMYRRVAQEAVRRGIDIKQNGLSELYDTWDEHTDSSYVWFRYKHTPGISLTHETGGQIYRNTLNAMGHPVSLLNRTMLNGTDYVFLYDGDIRAQHVQKYFYFAMEQLGRPLITKFYSRLGAYPLVNEHSNVPVPYRNMWLGLRQVDVQPDGKAKFTIVDGERCAATYPPHNDKIVFDVDDRQQYDGMFGVVVSVEYFDEGNGRFTTGVQNAFTGEWMDLGVTQKTDSKTWKTVSYYRPNWCDSPRNQGADNVNDLVIRDLSNSSTYVRNVELNFVPAREWKTREIGESKAEKFEMYSVLNGKLSRRVSVASNQPLNRFSIPLWTEGYDENGLMCSVYAVVGGERELLTRKEYYMAADADWLDLYFVAPQECSEYVIEVSDPLGKIGWYKDIQGELAVRTGGYVEEVDTQLLDTRKENDGFVFSAEKPFFGVQCLFDSSEGPVSWKLLRWLGESGWSEPVAAGTISTSQDKAYFEAQTAGKYKLVADGIEQLDLKPLYLVRLEEARLPVIPMPENRIIDWTMDRASNLSGWNVIRGLQVLEGSEANLKVAVTETNPVIESSVIDLSSDATQGILLRIKNGTGAAMARVYWRSKDEAFKSAKSIFVPLVSNDSEFRNVVFPIGKEDAWTGQLEQLRIEIVSGQTDSGIIELDTISVYTTVKL